MDKTEEVLTVAMKYKIIGTDGNRQCYYTAGRKKKVDPWKK